MSTIDMADDMLVSRRHFLLRSFGNDAEGNITMDIVKITIVCFLIVILAMFEISAYRNDCRDFPDLSCTWGGHR